jgi:hypothetical protein
MNAKIDTETVETWGGITDQEFSDYLGSSTRLGLSIIGGEKADLLRAQFSAEYDVSKRALAIIKKRLAAEQKALKLPVLDAPKRVRKPVLCTQCQCTINQAA